MEGCSSSRATAYKANGNSKGKHKNAQENVKWMMITVVKEHAEDATFQIKRDFALGKLMFEYCQQMNVNYKTYKFTYLGKQVSDVDTPDLLQMEDEDTIDCWADQLSTVL